MLLGLSLLGSWNFWPGLSGYFCYDSVDSDTMYREPKPSAFQFVLARSSSFWPHYKVLKYAGWLYFLTIKKERKRSKRCWNSTCVCTNACVLCLTASPSSGRLRSIIEVPNSTKNKIQYNRRYLQFQFHDQKATLEIPTTDPGLLHEAACQKNTIWLIGQRFFHPIWPIYYMWNNLFDGVGAGFKDCQ